MNTTAEYLWRRAGAALLLLLLPSMPLAAQNFAELETIFFDPALEAAEHDAYVAKLVAVIERDPASPEAWVALERAQNLHGELADTRPLFEALRRLAADGFARCGVNADAFVAAYESVARDYDAEPSWRKPVQAWDGLTECAWIGPFAEGETAHDDRFPPEVVCDFTREYKGAFGPVSWQKMRPPAEPGRALLLHDQARFTGSGYYVAYSLVSGSEKEVVIKPAFHCPGRVWLGGTLLCDADTRARDLPELWLPATLKRGRNLLLIKLSGLSMLEVRVRTPNGLLVEDLVCGAPDASLVPVSILAGSAIHANPSTPQITALDKGVAADARQGALLKLARSAACSANGLRVRAAELIEAAHAELPGEPLMALHYLESIEDSPLNSSGDKRRMRHETLDSLLERDPALLPALMLRAQDMSSDERWQDAADLLDRALTAAPRNWRVQLARAELFRRARWPAQWLEALNAARELAPRAIPVLEALDHFWAMRGASHAQAALHREMLASMPARRNSLASLSGLLLRTAEVDEALKLTRTWTALDPGASFALSRMAALHLCNGKVAEACAIYDQMAAHTARPEQLFNQAAQACLSMGDEERGAHYLARALAASQGEHDARRQLGRMRGNSEDFWTPYAMPWEEVQKIELTRAQFPRADSALILDESIDLFFEGGSSISYVHQVRKILTQGGVDARGRQSVPGELVAARTIKPDGTVLEPITFSGRQMEFPGVSVGCLVDLCWISKRPPGPWRVPVGQRFYFSDNGFDEPFAVSRYVVLAPASLPLPVFSHRIEPGEFKQRESGGLIVRTWDVRRPSHPQAESFAPSALETIPWIEFKHARGWESKARQVAERGLGMTRGETELIRERAAQITAGAASDEARARAIYAWVNANLTTQGDAGNAHQALKALAGDREELFVALCHAAGVKLGFAAADFAPEYRSHSNSEPPGLDWAGIGESDFDLFLVTVPGDDGRPIYLTLDERLRPFGALPSSRSRAPVITWRGGRATTGRLPGIDAGLDRFENRATIELQAGGGAVVKGSLTYTGERAWQPKDAFRTVPLDQQREFFEQQMPSYMPGLELEDYTTPGLDTPGTPFVRSYTGKVDGMARRRGAGLAMDIPVERLGQLLSVLVGTEERSAPLVLSFDYNILNEVRVVPPPGWRFKALPENLEYPTAPLVFSAQYSLEEGVLVIRRSLDLGPGRIEPVGYRGLVRQIAAIKDNEETLLELERAP